MKMALRLRANDFAVNSLEDLPPGHFVLIPSGGPGHLCFKSEYQEQDVFNESGEYLHPNLGDTFIPVSVEWEEE